MTSPSHDKPVIGILGGVGAGKSTVAAAFGELGCEIIDADAIGHELLGEREVRAELRERWGDGIFAALRSEHSGSKTDGAVARDSLARIVFEDEAELAALNAILHPRIRRRVEERIAAARLRPEVPATVLDAAVLIEAGWDDLCTHLIFVRAATDARRTRSASLRGWDRCEWRRREKSQISLDTKADRCDYVLDNSSSVSRLNEQVRRLFYRIMQAEGLC